MAYIPSIRFSPEVELLVASNLSIELRQSTKESLQNVPGSNGGKIGGVDFGGIDSGVSTSCIGLGRVLEGASDRVERALLFLRVTEANTERLGKEQHIRDFAPTVWVDLGCEVGCDIARTKF